MRRSGILGLVVIALIGTTATSVRADLTPINVPGDFDTLQVAIDYAQPDVHYVLVVRDTTFAPILMKSGVPVLADVGKTPIIDAGTATHAVLFPPDADANTILQGFEVVGGDTAVVLQGEGSLLDCIIAADPETQSIGVHHTGGSATIQACTLDGRSVGLWLYTGSLTLDGCSLNGNYAGAVINSSAATLSNCVLTSPGSGFDVYGGNVTLTRSTLSSQIFGLTCADNANVTLVESEIVGANRGIVGTPGDTVICTDCYIEADWGLEGNGTSFTVSGGTLRGAPISLATYGSASVHLQDGVTIEGRINASDTKLFASDATFAASLIASEPQAILLAFSDMADTCSFVGCSVRATDETGMITDGCGIRVDDYNTRIPRIIIDDVVLSGWRCGFEANGAGSLVTGTTCLGGDVGVYGDHPYRLDIEDCTFVGQSEYGVQILGAQDPLFPIDRDLLNVTDSYFASPSHFATAVHFDVLNRSPVTSGCTIIGWGTGIDYVNAWGLLATSAIEKNLVVGCAQTGIYAQTGPEDSLVVACNDVWGINGCFPDDDEEQFACTEAYVGLYGGPPASNLTRDPRFCSPALSDSVYSLRIDSPCAPDFQSPYFEGECGRIGKFGVECAWGELTRSTRVDAGVIAVLEDVIVPAGDTLTCDTGVVLRCDDNDESEGGLYSTKNEILVDGALVLDGVTIESDSETPAVGDWGAVVVRNNGSASIESTDFEGAETAIRVQDTADADIDAVEVRTCTNAVTCVDSSSVTVSGLTTGPNVKKGVQLFDSARVQVTGSTLAVNGPLSDGVTVSGSATLWLTNSSVSAARYGVYVTGGSANIYNGNDVSLAGVGVFATGGEVDVYDGTYHDLETGVWASGGAIDMGGGTIEDCTWGAWVDGEGGQLTLGGADGDLADSTQVLIRRCSEMGVGIDSQGPNQLTQVRVEGGDEDYWTGIQVLPSAACSMTRCSVANATGDGAVGMLIESQANLHAPKVENFLGSLSAGIRISTDDLTPVRIDSVDTEDDLWRNPKIRNCYYGIDVVGTAEPVVRGALVEDCCTCVNIGIVAVPDLGHDDWGEENLGHNVFQRARTRLAGSALQRLEGILDVPARRNYWGSVVPDASKISSWVDYIPYLQQNPLGQSRILVQIGPIGTTPSVIQAAFPMPFADRVNVPLVVGSVSEPVEASVFDVSGRRVRTLHSGQLPMGTHVLAWDGLTDDGSHASSGVYFIRVRLGNAESTQKLVLAR